MACSACARRRKALEAKLKNKKAQGKPVQAAVLGTVLAVTEAAGKAMGIHGEVEDEGSEAVSGRAGGSPDQSVEDTGDVTP